MLVKIILLHCFVAITKITDPKGYIILTCYEIKNKTVKIVNDEML